MSGWTTILILGATAILATFLLILTKWTLDYRSRESQSRAIQTQAQMEMMASMVRQSAEVVKIQTELTEALLLGRPSGPIELTQESESPSATLPTSEELWRDLPPNIQDAMAREQEEAATWLSPYPKPPEESVDDEMENQLRASLAPYGNGSAPLPDRST